MLSAYDGSPTATDAAHLIITLDSVSVMEPAPELLQRFAMLPLLQMEVGNDRPQYLRERYSGVLGGWLTSNFATHVGVSRLAWGTSQDGDWARMELSCHADGLGLFSFGHFRSNGETVADIPGAIIDDLRSKCHLPDELERKPGIDFEGIRTC